MRVNLKIISDEDRKRLRELEDKYGEEGYNMWKEEQEMKKFLDKLQIEELRNDSGVSSE